MLDPMGHVRAQGRPGPRQPGRPPNCQLVHLDAGVAVRGEDARARASASGASSRTAVPSTDAPSSDSSGPLGDQLVAGRRRDGVCGRFRVKPEHQVAVAVGAPPGKSHIVRPSVLCQRRSSTSR